GGNLARNAADILEDLRGIAPLVSSVSSPAAASAPNSEPPAGIDETQRRIWEFLAGQPRHIDDITRSLELSVTAVSQALLMLEMNKGVRRLPGNRFERR